MIPDSLREIILSRISLVQLMEREGIRFTRRGREYVALCPFHKEKTPSFFVNDDEGLYYCFGCHARGNALTFLKEYKRLSVREAWEEVARIAGVDIAPYLNKDRAQEENRKDYVALYQEAVRFYQRVLWSEAGSEVREYLFKRGLSSETIKAFRLGYSPGDGDLSQHLHEKGFDYAAIVKAGLAGSPNYRDPFSHRLMFPIYDKEGNPIAFGGRWQGKDEKVAKYINTRDTNWFRKGDVLYGFFQAKQEIDRKREVIVVEGYMDVIALHQAGIANTVAPLGTALTESHLQLLQRYADTVILLFDGDLAGLRAASRSLDLIRETSLEGKVAVLPEGKDPDEFILAEGKERFLEFVKTSSFSAVDFKWMFIQKYEMPQASLQKQLEAMFRFLMNMPQSSAQQEAIMKLASLLKLDFRGLYSDFKRFQSKLQRYARPDIQESSSLVSLQEKSMAEEYERFLLALTILFAQDVDVGEIASYVKEEMFSNKQYWEWFTYVVQHRPSVKEMADKITSDYQLYAKVMELMGSYFVDFSLERKLYSLMEQLYTFLKGYYQRRHQEILQKLGAEEAKEDKPRERVYDELKEVEDRLNNVKACLQEVQMLLQNYV